MKATREAYFEGQLDLDPDRLVFLNEAGASTGTARRYGRAPRGERCGVPVSLGHYKTTTVTAALRASGITVVSLLDTTMNGQRFRTYVEQTLVPELKPGDTVILDNLPAHKVAGLRTAIEAAGARLFYLPSYSADVKPIEQAFAKLKALLRIATTRTIPDRLAAIRRAFQAFTQTECRNYLRVAGYDLYHPT